MREYASKFTAMDYTPTGTVHPFEGSKAQGLAASADMHDRLARAMARVAADPKQSRKVRETNTRRAQGHSATAARLRGGSA